MNLQVVHYDVEPERTYIDYGPEGEELYLGEAPVICLTGVPVAEPVIDDSTERMGHYPVGTKAVIRRGFGELSVWQDDTVPDPTAQPNATVENQTYLPIVIFDIRSDLVSGV